MEKEMKEVLDFWFRETPEEKWWKKDPDFDRAVKERFLDVYEKAARGELGHWAETAKGALALIIVLDQFPRNMFRDTPRAFATDEKARTITRKAVKKGFDRGLNKHEKAFLYMPLEHGEDIQDQDEAVALFEKMGNEHYLSFAEGHRKIIREFGRFPHRNKILGRENTEREEEYLKDPNAGY